MLCTQSYSWKRNADQLFQICPRAAGSKASSNPKQTFSMIGFRAGLEGISSERNLSISFDSSWNCRAQDNGKSAAIVDRPAGEAMLVQRWPPRIVTAYGNISHSARILEQRNAGENISGGREASVSSTGSFRIHLEDSNHPIIGGERRFPKRWRR